MNMDCLRNIYISTKFTRLLFLFIGIILALLNISCDNSSNSVNDDLIGWNAPHNPYLAPDNRSNLHCDAYMTDTYNYSGPQTDNLNVTYSNLNSLSITIVFDKKGNVITLATDALIRRFMYILEPVTLEIIDTYEMPFSSNMSYSGSGYFYIDNNDNVIVPTVNKQIFKLEITGEPPAFNLIKSYDLSTLEGECKIVSVLPDWHGNLWFVTEDGYAGTISESNEIKYVKLQHIDDDKIINELVGNSFAIDETGGVFIVSDYALYRIDLENSNPVISWREEYDRGSMKKTGQFTQGSGTTPSLISNNYIAITDNADPNMNVLVFNRSKNFDHDRLLIKAPVFNAGRSATENSLITYDNAIIVENNYGYNGINNFDGVLSEPGLSKIVFDERGNYNIEWTGDLIVPSVVSKYSKSDNIIYSYTKDANGWYFTGINATIGTIEFKKKIGDDNKAFNNHYSGIAISESGVAYVGTVSGVIRISE